MSDSTLVKRVMLKWMLLVKEREREREMVEESRAMIEDGEVHRKGTGHQRGQGKATRMKERTKILVFFLQPC